MALGQSFMPGGNGGNGGGDDEDDKAVQQAVSLLPGPLTQQLSVRRPSFGGVRTPVPADILGLGGQLSPSRQRSFIGALQAEFFGSAPVGGATQGSGGVGITLNQQPGNPPENPPTPPPGNHDPLGAIRNRGGVQNRIA